MLFPTFHILIVTKRHEMALEARLYKEPFVQASISILKIFKTIQMETKKGFFPDSNYDTEAEDAEDEEDECEKQRWRANRLLDSISIELMSYQIRMCTQLITLFPFSFLVCAFVLFPLLARIN